MSMSTIQRCRTCLLLAALFIIGSRVVAQSTAADQNFKTIPQQIKTNAELKATNRANAIANAAVDKIDSGMDKAYRGLVGLFSKKKKPVAGGQKDSVGTGVPTGAGGPAKDSTGLPGTLVKDTVGAAPPVAKRG